MDKDLNDSDLQNTSITRDYENEESIVSKFKKNVSEIINITPLSKWFKKNDTPSVSHRKRQDDSDDETDFQEFQPPTKRTKLPPTKETLSLNVSEVLSPISQVNDVKKSLYKNFPEPIPGPSGYQTRKLLNSTPFTSENTYKRVKTTVSETRNNAFKNPKAMVSDRLGASNINKDINSDSEESTSGYSSGRIGSKEIVSQESSKQTSPLENSPIKSRSLFQSSRRSLFLERSLSPTRNSSLSSRMPSFNPCFETPNFVDRTLSTKKILDSPFYSGRTIYGGASAYGKSSGRAPQDLRKVLRQSVNIKPVNKELKKGDLQLGKTARRILDTLEQYSSPISDVKKIPITSKKIRSEGTLTKYIGTNPYIVRGSYSASNKELQVPTVTDFLKMKIDQQKTRLQDSTEAVRKIATKSKSVLNERTYQVAVQNEKEKYTGKIKTKLTSVRQKTQHEMVPELKLNPVALPIKDPPKFDFVVPPPAQATSEGSSEFKNLTNTPKSSVTFTKAKPVSMTECSETIKIDKSPAPESVKTVPSSSKTLIEFKFSAPIVLAECLRPIKALNNFKFSEPLLKKRRSIHPDVYIQKSKNSEITMCKKNNGENVFGMSNSTDNKTDMTSTNNGTRSLMDKFKPKEGTWECSICLIRNKAEKLKCAACETPRVTQSKTVVNDEKPLNQVSVSSQFPMAFSLGAKFKTPENTWECPTCMIRNKDELVKCIACETLKPGTKESSSKMFKPPTDNSATLFGPKFTPPSNTWECPTCMIRNRNELSRCEACETFKPSDKGQVSGTFGSDFKKKEDEWECEVCMVRNQLNSTKCQCCESGKPGVVILNTPDINAGSSTSGINFGVDKNITSTFTFGIPPSLQSTQAAPKSNAALVFGQKRIEPAEQSKEATKFTFGLPTNTPTTTSNISEPKKDTPKFSFGVAKENNETNKPTSVIKPDQPQTSFKVGDETKKEAGETNKEGIKNLNPLLKPGEKLPEKGTLAPAGFSFGLPKVPTQPSLISESVKSKETPTDDVPSKKTKTTGEASTTAKIPAFTFKPSTTNGDLNKISPFVKNVEQNKPASTSGFAFNFTSSKPTELPTTTTNTNITTFGIKSPQNDNSKTSSLFKFGSGSSETTPKTTNGFNFGATTSGFGTKDPVVSNTEQKSFLFGSPAALTKSTIPTEPGPVAVPPSFGAAPSKPPMFQFGAAPDNKPQNNTSSFSFSAPTSEKKTSQFSFGSTAANPPAAFNFGQPSAASTTVFGFGSTAPKSDSVFGIAPTSNHLDATNKSETIAFGAGAGPSQTTGPNGLFNFGATAGNNQKAIFNFGSSTDGGATSGNTSGFKFGSDAAATSTTSGGFNFSTSATSFDANAKPMFNFTGGNSAPTFSAAPAQDGAMPQRKIKKAIRRALR